MGMPGSRDDADAIVLFGGDGTIHRHLASLVRLGLPLLIVPAGSGNDFAGSIGLRRVRDALAAWKKFCDGAGNVRSIDLGVIAAVEKAVGAPAPHREPEPHGPRYFCCVAGVGLDGEVSRRANRLPRWLRGHGGYLLSLAPTIFTFAPLPMKICTPTESAINSDGWTTRSDGPTLLAAFANTPFYGGGMKIAPQAKMDDGLLDVCIVGGRRSLQTFLHVSDRLQRPPSGYPGGRILPGRAGTDRDRASTRCLCRRRIRLPHAGGNRHPSRRAEDCDALASRPAR